MRALSEVTEREIKIASVLRPLGTGPLSRKQAIVAGKLLDLHWTNVYLLRRRYLANPVASALLPLRHGPKLGNRIEVQVESIVQAALHLWLPKQKQQAHPLLDLCKEIGRQCKVAKVKAPSRNTVKDRWATYLEEQAALLADDPRAEKAPGHFKAKAFLDIVQIDHTQSDVFVVDPWFRRSLGRPWLTLAIDIATRCVVGFYVGMERPNAGTVALLLSRIALPKASWLATLGLQTSWPMQGIPRVLHMDNASEFRSKALRAGCSEYGIELMYRPVGRPHFGGHIERLNRTLMQRLKGLPGATGNSAAQRKAKTLKNPEEGAALTLNEFERWLAVEIGMRYHHSPHRGLMGATPAGAWEKMVEAQPARELPPGHVAAWDWLVHFMPLTHRTVQADGVTIFHIRYWHPMFAAWRVHHKRVLVRYHPEDLSRIFVSTNGKQYFEARCADLRRPPISLWEQRAICRILRGQDQSVSEASIFAAIELQRRIVAEARTETRLGRRQAPRKTKAEGRMQPWVPPPESAPAAGVEYDLPLTPFDVEVWPVQP
jgi:putative transposase